LVYVVSVRPHVEDLDIAAFNICVSSQPSQYNLWVIVSNDPNNKSKVTIIIVMISIIGGDRRRSEAMLIIASDDGFLTL
jgi:hypothetical protein